MSVTLHTDLGDLKIEVFCETVPQTAENFLALCASGYYDGSLFHRSIPTFILQTGAPSTASKPGKGGVNIHGHKNMPDEIRPSLRHNARGIVSMANSGKDTNGSQFFICYGKQTSLDGKNTVFGRVIEGAEEGGVLDGFEGLESDEKGRVVKEVRIKEVTMHANPLATEGIY